MKKILFMACLFAACNNDKSGTDSTEELKNEDQNRPTDTRLPIPSDTTKKVDTGDYNKVSDSIRK